jgi:excisionase family DNA binding protein
MSRPPSSYVFGEGRQAVMVLSAQTAYVLMTAAGVQSLAASRRGRNTDVDDELMAMYRLALGFQRGSSVAGTESASDPEQQPGSGQWFGVREAAQRLRCGDRAVRQAIARGRLTAQKHEGRWRINEADLEIYERDRGGNH